MIEEFFGLFSLLIVRWSDGGMRLTGSDVNEDQARKKRDYLW